MPLTFTVDHDRTVIFTTACGILSLADVRDHLQARQQAGVLAYGELFDLRDVSLDFSLKDLSEIAKDVRQVMGATPPGKVAAVTNNNFIYGLARTYQTMTAADNPRFEVFRDYEAGRSWLLQEGEEKPAQAAQE